MSRKYKFYDQDKPYFVTYATVGWIDIFTRVEYKNILLDSLKFCCKNKGLKIYAWCIMTNHVHLIIGTEGDKMENILRDHKRHTSETIIKAIVDNPGESRKEWMLALFKTAGINNSNNTNYQFWQQHNKPIELYTEDVFYQKLEYIHNNPVKAGFVDRPENWLYSSACDYIGVKGLLEDVILIEFGLRN